MVTFGALSNFLLCVVTARKPNKEIFKSSTTRQQFFSNRVFDNWNNLTDGTVVLTPSVNSFKSKLDKF